MIDHAAQIQVTLAKKVAPLPRPDSTTPRPPPSSFGSGSTAASIQAEQARDDEQKSRRQDPITGYRSAGNESAHALNAIAGSRLTRRKNESEDTFQLRKRAKEAQKTRLETLLHHLGLVRRGFNLDGDTNVFPLNAALHNMMDLYGIFALVPSVETLERIKVDVDTANAYYLSQINTAGSELDRFIFFPPESSTYQIILFHPSQFQPQGSISLFDPKTSSPLTFAAFEVVNGLLSYSNSSPSSSPPEPRPPFLLPPTVANLNPFLLTILAEHMSRNFQTAYSNGLAGLPESVQRHIELVEEVARMLMRMPVPTADEGIKIDELAKKRKMEVEEKLEREKRVKRAKMEKLMDEGNVGGSGEGSGGGANREGEEVVDEDLEVTKSDSEDYGSEEEMANRIKEARQSFALDKLEEGNLSGSEALTYIGEFVGPSFADYSARAAELAAFGRS